MKNEWISGTFFWYKTIFFKKLFKASFIFLFKYTYVNKRHAWSVLGVNQNGIKMMKQEKMCPFWFPFFLNVIIRPKWQPFKKLYVCLKNYIMYDDTRLVIISNSIITYIIKLQTMKFLIVWAPPHCLQVVNPLKRRQTYTNQ